MPLKIIVKSISDLERLSKELKIADMQFLQFQAVIVRKLANIIILETIQRRMEARGFSRKIIDNTFINNIEIKSKSTVRIFITSLYFADTGFDVALGREEGTDRHFIAPNEPTPERPNPHLKWIVGGKAFYSKGHWVDGVIAFYIIRDTIKEMKGHLQEEYNRAVTNWYISNFSGDIELAS